jgi:hypothetical protein
VTLCFFLSFQQFTICDVLDALLMIDVKNTSTGANTLDLFLLQLSASLIAES